MTHAFFKALLFLAAGSVIMGMHHEQDIRKMGGLKKYMPVTYWTSLIGSLALIGFPFLSGFYSKDVIIEAVHASNIPGAGIAYWAVLLGVFVTAFYSFRLFFLVFHGDDTLTVVKEHFHGPISFALHAVQTIPFWLAMAGVGTAFWFYMVSPSIPEKLDQKFSGLRRILDNKYGFDDFNQAVFAGGSVAVGRTLWKAGDQAIIDGALVNGSAKGIGLFANLARGAQTGYLYHYAFAMIIGLLALMTVFLFLI